MKLKTQIIKVIVDEDSFGLSNDFATNAFCPTGPGGGVDPSCSPGSGATHAMLDRLKKDGGFTFVAGQRKYQKIGTDGYGVSPYPERSQIFTKQVTLTDMRKFIKTNKDLLSKPSHAVGTWYDPSDKKTFLDVSIVVKDKKDADKLGRQHNQRSMFEFKTGKTIDLGGTGEAVKNV